MESAVTSQLASRLQCLFYTIPDGYPLMQVVPCRDSNSVIAGIPAPCPIVRWLILCVGNSRNRFDVLQAEFHRCNQSQRSSVLHCERLSVQVSRQKSLRMTSRRQIKRHIVWVRISPGTEIDR